MFVQSMKNPQLHIALECTSPQQAQRRLLNLRNYLKAILNVILLYLQTETQITRSNQSLNQQYQRILSGIYSIYQMEKKNSHFQNSYFMCQVFTEFIQNISFVLHKNSAKQVVDYLTRRKLSHGTLVFPTTLIQ